MEKYIILFTQKLNNWLCCLEVEKDAHETIWDVIERYKELNSIRFSKGTTEIDEVIDYELIKE